MFFIIEAGARIHTPVDNLLQRRDVPAVSASAPVRPVDMHETPAGEYHPEVGQAYREGAQQAPRHRVKFASEIMSSPVTTGHADQSLNEIWSLFAGHRIHHLPLLDSLGQVQGIVSDRDIMRFAANTASRTIGNTPIRQLMTRQVITATPDTEVRDLADVMLRRSIGAIPVVGEEGLDGIVSRSDILRTLVHRAPLDLWS